MWRVLAAAAFMGLAATSAASAAPPPPTPTPSPAPPQVSEQAIDEASFDDWRARQDERRETAEQAAKQKPKRKPKTAARQDEPPDPFWIRLQVLLDRAHVSPGAIDGRDGDNTRKAIRAFEDLRGLPVDGEPDPELWAALTAYPAKAAMVYEISQDDLKGPFEPNLPEDYSKLAKLKALAFRDTAEMLAERFHMDEKLLRDLNRDADFGKAGQRLLVVDPGPSQDGKVARIVVERKENDLRGFDKDGKQIFIAPATVGSSDTPTPKGNMRVNDQFPNPVYIYDPKKNFQQGKNRRKLTLPGGPNGPVGSMWIDLSKPTYGIHGTPEPSKISKTGSHGCVRLTNWDAEALARMIEPKKTKVEFR